MAANAPEVSNEGAQKLLIFIHYFYPIFLVCFFAIAFTVNSIAVATKVESDNDNGMPTGPGGKPLPRKKVAKAKVLDFTPNQKIFFYWAASGVCLTFAADAVVQLLHTMVEKEKHWWCGKDVVIYVVASLFGHGLVLISVFEQSPSPNLAHASTWLIALLMELVLLAAGLEVYTTAHREPSAKNPRGGDLRNSITPWELTDVVITCIRIFLLLALLSLYVLFCWLRIRAEENRMNSETSSPTESTSLLNGGAPNGNANGNPFSEAVEAQKDAWSRPDKMPTKSWWEYIRGYSLFFPYLWPAKSVRLQVTVVICFVIVMLLRLLNVLVPIQVGVITNELSGADGQEPRIPWLAISLYILYRTLQGSNGVLGALRSYLWIPISQYSYQELSTASFEHVHGLSLDFHLGKKTGEVLSALGKGQSINTFLEQVTFQMLPMLIDLAVAIGYFFIIFDEYYAMVIAIVSVTYLYVTIRLAAWRVQVRRDMVNADRQEDAVKNDSMVSYETVKYFNAEQYEFNRYRNAVQDYQKAEYKVLTSLNIMNVSQNLIFTLGLFITCFICAYQVTIGVRKVGDFVTLLIYMAQLQAPLNFFGTFYRSIQTAMINAERLLELFKEKPSVIDSPFARPLPSCEGEIRYSDVHFAYDPRKPALNGVTFTCAPGTTTALVGETGGGKSTIFRLLFRFYNATSGSIQIDGHDVDNITIDSLRRLIGVVPQDTVLFNESLMYNLKYANPSATDEDVYAACRAASIHDKIMAFPDGYNARVGERGLKLSGGEKQRVAIARTIIKDPRIILLDEATAALDSETEQHIQEALDQLSQGRTTLVIAHRLSTITMADQILVLQGGKISEAGSHDELLAKKGKYASMWRKQIRAQKAAEEAKVLSDRAEQLRSGSLIDESADHSEDERSGGSGKKSRPLSQSGLRTPLLELDSMNFTTVPNTIITRPS